MYSPDYFHFLLDVGFPKKNNGIKCFIFLATVVDLSSEREDLTNAPDAEGENGEIITSWPRNERLSSSHK